MRMTNPAPNLDNLSRTFLAELEVFVPRAMFRTVFTDSLVVTIPARNQEVGDITVWLDDGEVTVGIGQIYHIHFEVFTETPSLPTLAEREQTAAQSAAEYIRDFMADKIQVRVQFRGGSCLGASHWYREDTGPIGQMLRGEMLGADEIRDYIWSGRITTAPAG